MQILKFKYPYVPQVDERDCGVAALSMILKFYNSTISLAHLRELAQTDMAGTTALGIMSAAKKLGLQTRGVKGSDALLTTKKIILPFIAHVKKDNKYFHYYVVFKVEKNYLIIGDPDPSKGILKIKKTQFLQEWSGVAILFLPQRNYKAIKEEQSSLLHYAKL